jgi:hypothetical protein
VIAISCRPVRSHSVGDQAWGPQQRSPNLPFHLSDVPAVSSSRRAGRAGTPVRKQATLRGIARSRPVHHHRLSKPIEGDRTSSWFSGFGVRRHGQHSSHLHRVLQCGLSTPVTGLLGNNPFRRRPGNGRPAWAETASAARSSLSGKPDWCAWGRRHPSRRRR